MKAQMLNKAIISGKNLLLFALLFCLSSCDNWSSEEDDSQDSEQSNHNEALEQDQNKKNFEEILLLPDTLRVLLLEDISLSFAQTEHRSIQVSFTLALQLEGKSAALDQAFKKWDAPEGRAELQKQAIEVVQNYSWQELSSPDFKDILRHKLQEIYQEVLAPYQLKAIQVSEITW